MPTQLNPVGLGTANCPIHFYIANRPDFADYPRLNALRPLVPGELQQIVANTSNHWRKLFNVYAKLLFDWYGLTKTDVVCKIWQTYREHYLFQAQSAEALLFSPPDFTAAHTPVHIIAGKTYAASLALPPLQWLDNYFAINRDFRLIVAPYPDYRQLSNARIARLIELMDLLRSGAQAPPA